ncbi:NnrU family protein [Altererythrobacter sp. ZODW24]|uniref:NnrU family protein n=1 Tax=Altererythrobacter sp. ZODW24 TaxID=2185142 RepID=UPI000DF7F0A9|nr:NnrU family protein [Altererythrobacter sp. ZODW24]
MGPELTSLLAASTALVGSHFALSHPLRAPMVAKLGENGFLGVYSLINLAFFVWMIWAFTQVPAGGVPLWNGTGDIMWAIGSVLTLVAMVMFLGAYIGNPAMPQPGAEALARKEPHGAFRVTRHPMMWGFAIWGASHILVMPTPRTVIFAGAIFLLALLGARMQDRKKEALMGEAWVEWESKTSFIPQLGRLFSVGPVLWIVAVAVWMGLTWLHIWMGSLPAGLWRWIG